MEKYERLENQHQFSALLKSGMTIIGEDEIMTHKYRILDVAGDTVTAVLVYYQNCYMDNHYRADRRLYKPHPLDYKAAFYWEINGVYYTTEADYEP